jgi:hypothetical protein
MQCQDGSKPFIELLLMQSLVQEAFPSTIELSEQQQ